MGCIKFYFNTDIKVISRRTSVRSNSRAFKTPVKFQKFHVEREKFDALKNKLKIRMKREEFTRLASEDRSPHEVSATPYSLA